MAIGGGGLPRVRIRSSRETVIAVGLSVGTSSSPSVNCSIVPIACLSGRLRRASARMSYTLQSSSALQSLMTNVLLVAFAKFTVVSLLGTVAAFAVAHVAGRVPGIRARSRCDFRPRGVATVGRPVEQLTAIPDKSDTRSFKSSAVKLGRTVSSILFSRKAALYCSRPSLRSQPPSMAASRFAQRYMIPQAKQPV